MVVEYSIYEYIILQLTHYFVDFVLGYYDHSVYSYCIFLVDINNF